MKEAKKMKEGRQFRKEQMKGRIDGRTVRRKDGRQCMKEGRTGRHIMCEGKITCHADFYGKSSATPISTLPVALNTIDPLLCRERCSRPPGPSVFSHPSRNVTTAPYMYEEKKLATNTDSTWDVHHASGKKERRKAGRKEGVR